MDEVVFSASRYFSGLQHLSWLYLLDSARWHEGGGRDPFARYVIGSSTDLHGRDDSTAQVCAPHRGVFSDSMSGLHQSGAARGPILEEGAFARQDEFPRMLRLIRALCEQSHRPNVASGGCCRVADRPGGMAITGPLC